MKRTLKELLWFVIPTVLIVATYATIYATADLQINIPKWIGMNEYFLLFSKSPEFAEAVFNTVLYNAVPALVTAAIVFVVQLFAKMKRPRYYGNLSHIGEPLLQSVLSNPKIPRFPSNDISCRYHYSKAGRNYSYSF